MGLIDLSKVSVLDETNFRDRWQTLRARIFLKKQINHLYYVFTINAKKHLKTAMPFYIKIGNAIQCHTAFKLLPQT